MPPMKNRRWRRSRSPPASAGIPPLINVEICDEDEELIQTYTGISMDACMGALAEDVACTWQVGVKEIALSAEEVKAWPPGDEDGELRADYIHARDSNELRGQQSIRIRARKVLTATDSHGHCDVCHQNHKELFRRTWRDNDGANLDVGICRFCEGRKAEMYQSSKNSGLPVGAVWLHSSRNGKRKTEA